MTIKVYSEDSRIYSSINDLWLYLYDCLQNNVDPVIDLAQEGPCARAIGLYDILEKFCKQSGFDPTRISIVSGNVLESHTHFRIVLDIKHAYWDFNGIKKWITTTPVDFSHDPKHHFSNFVGRSSWERLWLASWLYSRHANKTLQTFCSSMSSNYKTKVEDHVSDYLGLENLNYHNCDILPAVAEFLTHCPITLEPNARYPLLFPDNMFIMKYYRDIFVDVICETNVSGNSFFVTEKTWRSMIAYRPFVTMSNVNFLHNLHKLGFRTFNQWWDESYDNYSDQTRLQMITQVLDTIATWSPDKLQKTLIEMKPVLEHNKQVFMQLKLNEIAGLINER